MIGGAGEDFLVGGAGADQFVFTSGSGEDWIDDFDVTSDKIDLRGFADIDSFSSLIPNACEWVAGSTWLYANEEDFVRLEGVSIAQLREENSFRGESPRPELICFVGVGEQEVWMRVVSSLLVVSGGVGAAGSIFWWYAFYRQVIQFLLLPSGLPLEPACGRRPVYTLSEGQNGRRASVVGA